MVERSLDQWGMRVKGFRERNGFWIEDQWGPPPGRPRCAAPRTVLDEYGFGVAKS